jgi:hypothetical protein
MTENFKKVYNKELLKYDSPEVSQIAYDILNHPDVRAHCYEVCKNILKLELEKHDIQSSNKN